jgi:rod shape-determining protein MreB
LRENFFSLFSHDIGIDLGTANTMVYVKGEGIVLREPSIVAVQKDRRRDVLAVGKDAKRMLGRTPGSIVAIRPMKDGVIADFEIVEVMLRYFIRSAVKKRSFFKPRIVVAVPSGITEVEKRAVRDSAENAGAKEVYLIEEPMAAAIGAGLPIAEPAGNMIVDIGGGTAEVAVISLSGIVCSSSLRVAGDKMDEAIMAHVKNRYKVAIGERTAEDVKLKIGNAFPLEKDERMDVKGRDMVSGLPKTISLTSSELREALGDPIASITETIRATLDRTPPELAGDIVDRGIIMAGGTSLLRGLDKHISSITGLPVNLAEDPMTCVVRGTGMVLDELKALRKVLLDEENGF